MQIDYKRDLNHAYLILQEKKEPDTASYQMRMLLTNTIPGLLECRIGKLDDSTLFYYEITSRQSVQSVFEQRSIHAEALRHLFESLLELLEQLSQYLLNPDGLVLLPELIFTDAALEHFSFCYLPGEWEKPESFQEQMQKLMEYILPRLDHQEQAAVVLGYGLCREISSEVFSIEHVKNLIYQKTEESGTEEPLVEHRMEREEAREKQFWMQEEATYDYGNAAEKEKNGFWNAKPKLFYQTLGSEAEQFAGLLNWKKSEHTSKKRRKEKTEESGKGENPTWIRQKTEAPKETEEENSRGQSVRNLRLEEPQRKIQAEIEQDVKGSNSQKRYYGEETERLLREWEKQQKKRETWENILESLFFVLLFGIILIFRWKQVEEIYYWGLAGGAGSVAILYQFFLLLDKRKRKRKRQKIEEMAREQRRFMTEETESEEMQSESENSYPDSFDSKEHIEPDQQKYNEAWEKTELLTSPDIGKKACLVPVESSDLPVISVEPGSTLIGKLGTAADVILPCRTVSRLHAKLISNEEGDFLVDLNSRNGTYVNGVPIMGESRKKLEDGDDISFGGKKYRYVAGKQKEQAGET